jgi:Epoxide hydrolase N terminus
MSTSKATEAIAQDRRRLLSTATMGIAVASAANLLPSQLAAAPLGDAIRPFRIDVPEEQLVDLRRRIAATRWPDQETVNDRSQGVQLAKFQEVVRYWGTDYDWRKAEAKLNALPQFITTIDDVDIHFIHVRSRPRSSTGSIRRPLSPTSRLRSPPTGPHPDGTSSCLGTGSQPR